MISRSQRLQGKQVTYLLRKGIKLGSKYFTIKSLPESSAKSRFSVIINSQLAPSACQRNLLRRQIYTILRNHQSELAIPSMLALIGKNGIENLPFQELELNITSILKTIK